MENYQIYRPQEEEPAPLCSFDSGIDVDSSDEKEVLSKAEQIYFESYFGLDCREGEIDERYLESSPINFKPFRESNRVFLDKEQYSNPVGEMTKRSLFEGLKRTKDTSNREDEFLENIVVTTDSSNNVKKLPISLFSNDNCDFESTRIESLGDTISFEEDEKRYSCYCSDIESLNSFDLDSTEVHPGEIPHHRERKPQNRSSTQCSKQPNLFSRMTSFVFSLIPKVLNGIPIGEDVGEKIIVPQTEEPLSIKDEIEAALATSRFFSSFPLPVSCFEKILQQWIKANVTEETLETNRVIVGLYNRSMDMGAGHLIDIYKYLCSGKSVHKPMCSGIEELSNMAEDLKRRKNMKKK